MAKPNTFENDLLMRDEFALYRDQARAFAERDFPTTAHSSDMMKLFQRTRRRK